VFCPKCGLELPDSAQFCMKCGYALTGDATPNPPSGAECPYCKKTVIPMVHSVGGGSCSVGSRERWTCPSCRRVIFRKGCLVATAAYGNEDFIEVQFLRAFRDSILRRSFAGSAFIDFYYAVSPYLAWCMERIPILKAPARRCLDVVVFQIEKRTALQRGHFRVPD
jgi:hypothetical protein